MYLGSSQAVRFQGKTLPREDVTLTITIFKSNAKVLMNLVALDSVANLLKHSLSTGMYIARVCYCVAWRVPISASANEYVLLHRLWQLIFVLFFQECQHRGWQRKQKSISLLRAPKQAAAHRYWFGDFRQCSSRDRNMRSEVNWSSEFLARAQL